MLQAVLCILSQVKLILRKMIPAIRDRISKISAGSDGRTDVAESAAKHGASADESAPSGKSKRIVAFDLLRGFFLIVVIIDHVELFPNGYELITGRGQLWVSAAEGFFFLSGLLVGMIYRKKLAQGVQFVFRKLWSRAALLYVVAVSLTLFYTAWALSTGDAEAVKYAAAKDLGWGTIIDTLKLKYVYGWSDFLTYYVVFMFFAPFVLYLLRFRLWWLVIVLSIVIWFNRGSQFTYAWQVLFYGGMMVGYYWKSIQSTVAGWSASTRRILWYSVVTATLVTVFVSFCNLLLLAFLRQHPDMFSDAVNAFANQWYVVSETIWPYFEKWRLEPGRIAMFALWFSGFFLLVQRYAYLLPRRVFNAVTLMGQNSLFVYGFHSFFVFAVHVFIPNDKGPVFNFLVTTLVLAIMVGLTYGKTMFKRRYDSRMPWRRA